MRVGQRPGSKTKVRLPGIARVFSLTVFRPTLFPMSHRQLLTVRNFHRDTPAGGSRVWRGLGIGSAIVGLFCRVALAQSVDQAFLDQLAGSYEQGGMVAAKDFVPEAQMHGPL